MHRAGRLRARAAFGLCPSGYVTGSRGWGRRGACQSGLVNTAEELGSAQRCQLPDPRGPGALLSLVSRPPCTLVSPEAGAIHLHVEGAL